MQLVFKESLKIVTQTNSENIIDTALVTLGFSRYDVANIIQDKTIDSIIDFLVNCFEALYVVPHQLVIDNAKALVTKPKTLNSKVILNTKIEQFTKIIILKYLLVKAIVHKLKEWLKPICKNMMNLIV